MARRRFSTKSEREHLPKLESGDEVPRTGHYRLDEGVRVKPVRSRGSRIKGSKPKPYRLKKIITNRTRRR